MQTKPLALAAAFAFALTGVSAEPAQPKIYFPRQVKRQFDNSTDTLPSTTRRPLLDDILDPVVGGGSTETTPATSATSEEDGILIGPTGIVIPGIIDDDEEDATTTTSADEEEITIQPSSGGEEETSTASSSEDVEGLPTTLPSGDGDGGNNLNNDTATAEPIEETSAAPTTLPTSSEGGLLDPIVDPLPTLISDIVGPDTSTRTSALPRTTTLTTSSGADNETLTPIPSDTEQPEPTAIQSESSSSSPQPVSSPSEPATSPSEPTLPATTSEGLLDPIVDPLPTLISEITDPETSETTQPEPTGVVGNGTETSTKPSNILTEILPSLSLFPTDPTETSEPVEPTLIPSPSPSPSESPSSPSSPSSPASSSSTPPLIPTDLIPTLIPGPTAPTTSISASVPPEVTSGSIPVEPTTASVPTDLPGAGNGTSTDLSDITTPTSLPSEPTSLPTEPTSVPTSVPEESTSVPVPPPANDTSVPPPESLTTPTVLPTLTNTSPSSVPTLPATPTTPTTPPVVSSASEPPSDPTTAPTSVIVPTEPSEPVESVPSSAIEAPTSEPQKPPMTSIVPTATFSNTDEWMPTTIVADPTSFTFTPPTETETATSSKALPTNIPQIILPNDSEKPIPEGSVEIQIGFRYPLNYNHVAKNTMAAAQIFKYLPMALSFAGEFKLDKVQVSRLVPDDTRAKWGYVTTLAMVHYPEALLDKLQTDLWEPLSDLYNHPNSLVRDLTADINEDIDIFGNIAQDDEEEGEGQSEDDNGNNSDALDSGNDGNNSAKQQATTAGIAVGAFGLAALYGGAMFIVARRYKRKRQSHRRASSLSGSDVSSEMQYGGNGSPAMMGGALMSQDMSHYGGVGRERDSHGSGPSARTANISAPVATENSLGWN